MAEMSLSDVLVQLRKELKAAQEKAMNDELQLSVKDIEIELDKANAILKDRMIDAVFTTTEKMIKERLDRETHTKLVDDFLNQFKVN